MLEKEIHCKLQETCYTLQSRATAYSRFQISWATAYSRPQISWATAYSRFQTSWAAAYSRFQISWATAYSCFQISWATAYSRSQISWATAYSRFQISGATAYSRFQISWATSYSRFQISLQSLLKVEPSSTLCSRCKPKKGCETSCKEGVLHAQPTCHLCRNAIATQAARERVCYKGEENHLYERSSPFTAHPLRLLTMCLPLPHFLSCYCEYANLVAASQIHQPHTRTYSFPIIALCLYNCGNYSPV